VRWVLLALSVLFSLVLAELVARQVVPEVNLETGLRDGGVLVPYQPGATADLLTDEFRVRYEINQFGYRDRLDRRAERTPGVPRIALLGDSFSAGWGVEFKDTFANRVERDTGIEVVNSAKNGGCAIWFVPQARYIRARFSPDWLLVQVFDNDPEDDAIWSERFELPIGERFRELPEELGLHTSLRHRLARAFDGLVLRKRIQQLKRRLRGEQTHSTPYVKPGAKSGQHIMTREEAIAAHDVVIGPDAPISSGFAFHLPEQSDAWKERIAWNSLLLDQMIEESQAAGVPVAVLYIPIYQTFLRPPAPNPLEQSTREVAERRGALWLDAGEYFAATRSRPWELYYAYDGHLNADGHAAVAELLERDLVPRVRGG